VKPSRVPYREIAAKVREQIVSGRIVPGDRVTPLRELAVTYGVAQGTAAAAMEVLRSEGLIETVQGKGSVVIAAEPSSSPDADVGGLRAEVADLRAELAAARDELAAARDELRAEVADLRAELAAARDELAAARDELRAEVADLRADVERLEVKVSPPVRHGGGVRRGNAETGLGHKVS
jgi:DNA-binding FadR family transcriptional regulator